MKLALAASAAILGLALVACGSCGARTPHKTAESADLVVFSSHPEELVRVVLAEFRDRSRLKVRYVHGGTTEMLDRLRAQVEAGLVRN